MIQIAAAMTNLRLGSHLTEARRAATPHLARQPGLTVRRRGCPFEEELSERLAWCDLHCPGGWEIETETDEDGRPAGQVFRFADDCPAVEFRLLFS